MADTGVPCIQHGQEFFVVPKASVAKVLKMAKGSQVVGKVLKEAGAWLGGMEIT